MEYYTKPKTFLLPVQLCKELKIHATENETTQTSIVIQALWVYLHDHKTEKEDNLLKSDF